MRIELKCIQLGLAISEKTIVFTGDLWISGRRAAYCSRTGDEDIVIEQLDSTGGDLIRAAEHFVAQLEPRHDGVALLLHDVVEDLLEEHVAKASRRRVKN